MGFIAIVGCGPLGGALAHKLALRDRVTEVRLIDPHGGMAAGKALDIAQSAPVDRFATRLTSATRLDAAAGAEVIALADDGASGAEHDGEPGLALLRLLKAIEPRAPLVFAGATQRQLIAAAASELHLPRHRLVGSAPGALESALRALAAVLLDVSALEISLRVVGVPPRHAVVAWEAATVSGMPLGTQLAPHLVAALQARIPGIWPPGPYALASAAAQVVDGMVTRSRSRYSCFVAMDGGAVRCAVTAMPVEVNEAGVGTVLEPALTRQERTLLENAIEV
jgi:malate dehydrogenase